MVKRSRVEPDFLDEIIAESSKGHPEFPQLVEAAYQRRKLLRALAGERERAGISQTAVAARMRTSQSAVARLEAGEIDAKMSTVERFAAAVGRRVDWRVVRAAPRRATTRAAKAVAKKRRRVLDRVATYDTTK